MADRSHYRQITKCDCGRELKSRDERELGECRRCQNENDDGTVVDFNPDLEMRTDERFDD